MLKTYKVCYDLIGFNHFKESIIRKLVFYSQLLRYLLLGCLLV